MEHMNLCPTQKTVWAGSLIMSGIIVSGIISLPGSDSQGSHFPNSSEGSPWCHRKAREPQSAPGRSCRKPPADSARTWSETRDSWGLGCLLSGNSRGPPRTISPFPLSQRPNALCLGRKCTTSPETQGHRPRLEEVAGSCPWWRRAWARRAAGSPPSGAPWIIFQTAGMERRAPRLTVPGMGLQPGTGSHIKR